MPLQRTRRIPTANPGREARAALHIISKIFAVRCLLIGPKILEARAAIGAAKSRIWIASRSKAVAAFCFLSLDSRQLCQHDPNGVHYHGVPWCCEPLMSSKTSCSIRQRGRKKGAPSYSRAARIFAWPSTSVCVHVCVS